MKLPLGRGAYERALAQQPAVKLFNRYFEENPTNRETGTSLLSRPGNQLLTGFGSGPIREIWYQDGTFDGALFVVSGPQMFKYEQDGTKTLLVGTVAGSPNRLELNGTEDNVYVADGTTLQYYNGVGDFATGVLTSTANPADGDTVTTGAFTYTFNTVLGVPAAYS